MAKIRIRWLRLALLPGVFLLAIGVAFLVFWIGFDATSYQEVVLRQLSSRLGRPVRVEGVGIDFLPPRLRLLGVEVGESPGAPENLLFTARSVDAAFNLGALFGSEPAFQRFQVIEPTIYLRQDQSGKWNLSSITDRWVASAGAKPQEHSEALPVRDWHLQEGTVVIQRLGRDPVRLTSLEASVTDLSTSDPFPVELQFRIGGAGRIRAAGRLRLLEGNGGPTFTTTVTLADITSEDVETALGFSALPPSVSRLNGSLELELLAETSRLEGVLDMQIAEGQKLTPLGDWKLNGSADLSDLRCQLADGADPMRIGSLQASFQPDRIETIAEGVMVGEEEFCLTAEVKSFQTPRITFRLSGDRLDWTALRSHLTSAAGRSGSDRSRHQCPMVLRSAQGKGELRLVRLVRADLQMGPITSGLILDRGTIRLRPIQMSLHGGRATSSLTLVCCPINSRR